MSTSWKTWSIEKLEEAIAVLDRLFYEGQDTLYDGKIVSNTEYDFMRKRLEKERPDSPILAKVTNNRIASTATTFEHHPPFCSLSKINREAEKEKYSDLVEWLNDRQEDINWD